MIQNTINFVWIESVHCPICSGNRAHSKHVALEKHGSYDVKEDGPVVHNYSIAYKKPYFP